MTAASDSFELPYYLGPHDEFHLWWGAMFPDLEIDADGGAHIAFAHDPTPPDIVLAWVSTQSECGDIRYIASSSPPYRVWSAPVTLNDDDSGMAQGFVALETSGGGVDKGDVVVGAHRQDYRLSPTRVSNGLFDQFFASKRGSWSSNHRLTTTSSASHEVWAGGYAGVTAVDDGFFATWTDRREEVSRLYGDHDVYGASVRSRK